VENIQPAILENFQPPLTNGKNVFMDGKIYMGDFEEISMGIDMAGNAIKHLILIPF